MDFHSLSRRELQALCKRNNLPANVTNVDMADSLQALDIVEGVDEVFQACKFEISESTIEPRCRLEITSPYLPPVGGRSTRAKDVLLTPAHSVASRRRIAEKEDSALMQICGTRRSARLAEKSAKLLQGVTPFSKKDLFTGEGQEFKMNLEKSLDGSVQVSGLTEAEESERTDELSSAATEDEVGNHSDNALQSKLKEGVDSNTLTSVEEIEVPTIEEERHSTLDNDGLDAVQTSETKITSVKAEITEEKIAEDVELVDEPVVENEDLAFAVVSSDTVIQSDGQIAFDEIDEDVDLNTDSSETKSNPDESDSVNDSMPSEISLVKNAAVPSFIKQPILSTPKRASTRRIRVSSDSDNKENIGSGSKTAPAKERSKIFQEIAETVPKLDNASLMKLSKKMKELALTQKSDKNEGEYGASARTALQPLSDNQKAK
ncbi:uncharacterized protein LOC121764743 isoform X2 [Salvia splendens]|uniref:uncharacterized protein LOC121764743 isoform X2 n=1 Tax=Salvia splendens TaxID=180675 RepID=UPI001C27A81A|nr:uncharacterized protein LOC121764743 isoform X2 [Salvia splendens]